ncbi:hypothetical protein QFC21_003376 [Naganishia friedmannii]|uniref:Uncharacterized protein n=1 Tax=Naganishia friedmannii TaxID=89922 RepID=A0ACC2VPQ6_9TREE|nr:hypothetical protein QFC21_003376 [Naganishia friedmannii]
METEAAASFSRLTLISNFGPPPMPPLQQQQPVSPVNGQTISHSQSMNSAMSLETNDEDEEVSGIDGLPHRANGHQRRNRHADNGDVAGTYDMDGREEDDDLYDRNIKLSKSLSVEESKKPVVHIEARLVSRSMMRFAVIQAVISEYIQENFDRLEVGAELEGWRDIHTLANSVDRLVVAESSSTDAFPEVSKCRLAVHVYQPSSQHGVDEFAATTGGEYQSHKRSVMWVLAKTYVPIKEEDNDESNVMAATVRELPSRDMDGLWDSLIYADDVKPRLLNYIYTTLLFSDANVDFNIVTWNRVVLLHGPPGTGKTSLCRALAQKLAIRLSSRYTHGKLVEINSHSLFSKWFSESGKLVQKLFARVTEMVEDEGVFVVVLIGKRSRQRLVKANPLIRHAYRSDEVESLTAARAGAMSGTEPSDALRVVNALLTQLDKLKHHAAFIDRADIKQYIGLPPPQAVYWIVCGCLSELMRTGIILPLDLLDWKDLQVVKNKRSQRPERERMRQASLRIAALAEKCQGMSGRTLRRLPVLAHARYIGINTTDEMHHSPLEDWIHAIEKVVEDEGDQLRHLEELVGTGKI